MRSLAVLLALCAATAQAQDRPRLMPKIEAGVLYDHRSNVFVLRDERTEDFLGPVITLVWPKVEIDLAHGVTARDCALLRGGACRTEAGSRLTTRWYPRRK